MKGFLQTIKEWVGRAPRKVDAVHKRSLEKLAVELTRTKAEGGNVPFDTGNLYRSLVASTSGLPDITSGPSQGSDVGIVIAKLNRKQPIYFGYTAAYARRMNYGFVGSDSMGRVYNQEGNYFLERAVDMWPQIVEESAREVRTGAIS